MQDVHHGLPVGIAPVQPADEEGREVQLLHGEGGPGLWPACAQMCATHCLYFGNINEYASVLRERYARRIAESVEMQVEAAAVGR